MCVIDSLFLECANGGQRTKDGIAVIGAAAVRLQARIALEELLVRCPEFSVDFAAGTFAGGNYVRRYATLPFSATGVN